MAETQNYHAIGYGNKDGEIKFGHIHEDGVVSAASLRSGRDPTHFISLDSSGSKTRKHGTICSSPGTFQVLAGENVPYGESGVFIDAENGDLVLRAKNGRIRILAENIDIFASGADGKNGVVRVEGNEKVVVKSQIIEVSSTTSTKIFSEKTVNVIGKGILDIYGGLIDAADGATKIKGSKGGSTNEDRHKQ